MIGKNVMKAYREDMIVKKSNRKKYIYKRAIIQYIGMETREVRV